MPGVIAPPPRPDPCASIVGAGTGPCVLPEAFLHPIFDVTIMRTTRRPPAKTAPAKPKPKPGFEFEPKSKSKPAPASASAMSPNASPGIGTAPEAQSDPASFIPPFVPAILRERRLLANESREASDALTEAVCEALGPRNLLEFMAIKRLADQIWLDIRHEGLRTALLDLETLSATRDLIDIALCGRYPNWDERKRIVEQIHDRWLAGTPAGRSEVEALLARAGQSPDMAQARAFAKTMKAQYAFDVLSRSASRSRRDALAELQAIRRMADGEALAEPSSPSPWDESAGSPPPQEDPRSGVEQGAGPATRTPASPNRAGAVPRHHRLPPAGPSSVSTLETPEPSIGVLQPLPEAP